MAETNYLPEVLETTEAERLATAVEDEVVRVAPAGRIQWADVEYRTPIERDAAIVVASRAEGPLLRVWLLADDMPVGTPPGDPKTTGTGMWYTKEDIKAAQGQVDAAKGKVGQIQTMLDELSITAPRGSRVESLDLRPGDILAPNATAATLIEDDQLYVRIYVPETLIGRVRVGQDVPIHVDSFAGRSFKGVVEHINGVGEYSPRNLQTSDERADQVFATRIGLIEGRDDLRAGMAAFITVPR